MRPIRLIALLAALLFAPALTFAQTSPAAQNPLRPSNAPKASAAPAAPAAGDETSKPKRARSQAQLANDERLRACGKQWRENKASLQAKGQTWLSFSADCRKRLKAAGQ